MCVAVRKKLQLYFWKDREFHELQVSCVLSVARVSQQGGELLFLPCSPCYSGTADFQTIDGWFCRDLTMKQQIKVKVHIRNHS